MKFASREIEAWLGEYFENESLRRSAPVRSGVPELSASK